MTTGQPHPDFLKDYTSANTLKREAQRLRLPLRAIGYKDLIEDLPIGATIVNLDDHNSGFNGTHWTAIWHDVDRSFIYFDSFGYPPPRKLEAMMFRRGDGYTYSKFYLQDATAGGCGNYVIQFIEWMTRRNDIRNVGDRFRAFIDEFSENVADNRAIVNKMAYEDLP